MKRRDYMKTMTATSVGMAIGPTLRPIAAEATPPNLLFIMTDQQRWDTLSIAGNTELSTPNLDRLDALGWKLYEIESLNSSNGWNEVADGIVATNGNKVYTLPGSSPGAFFKMSK